MRHTNTPLTRLEDYQQYASEESEKLAQAIAKGIPNTLRGMMWQLMCVDNYSTTADINMPPANYLGLHRKIPNWRLNI
jgi:hypothetical protein